MRYLPKVSFEIDKNDQIDFVIYKENSVSFDIKDINITIGDGEDPYLGPYIVTPAFNTQTLQTYNKTCNANINIQSIPYAKVPNPQGGETITIGG